MPGRTLVLASIAVALSLTACSGRDQTVRGFVLPEGDIDAGRRAFVEYGCQQCHVLDDDALPAYEEERRFKIRLGGEALRVKDYGDLLTSIVIPNHRLSQKHLVKDEQGQRLDESPMPEFMQTMTVAELIDLVTYLHSRYSETSSAYQGYSYVR